MSDWNPQQYLRFANERTRPVHDLISRISLERPGRVLDIGCGPGNSTAALKGRWPNAEVIGLDSSPSMVERAGHDCPGMKFMVRDASGDLSDLGRFDVVFANASLQWMPNHDKLLPRLFSLLSPGGVLAAQVPQYDQMPISGAIAKVTVSPRWATLLRKVDPGYSFNPDEFYYDTLSALSGDIQMWATEYFHIMPGHQDIITMMESTGLRPYLDALSKEEASELRSSVLEELMAVYPARRDGKVLFPFKRLFFTAASPPRPAAEPNY